MQTLPRVERSVLVNLLSCTIFHSWTFAVAPLQDVHPALQVHIAGPDRTHQSISMQVMESSYCLAKGVMLQP